MPRLVTTATEKKLYVFYTVTPKPDALREKALRILHRCP